MASLALFILTYNIGLMAPSLEKNDVHRLVWPDALAKQDKPDIYVVGLQEPPKSGSRENGEVLPSKTWMDNIRKELFANGYAQLTDDLRSNGALLTVFTLYKNVPLFNKGSMKSGVGGKLSFLGGEASLGTGAVFVSWKLGGKTICFINTFMPRPDNKADLDKLKGDLIKFKDSFNAGVDSLDHVFWFGDMYFSIEPGKYITNDDINLWSKNGNHKDIVYYDQLGYLLQKDRYFQGYSELDVEFPPSYKYLSKYDYEYTSINGKLSTPAYTDRIFYKNPKRDSIKGVFYKANSELTGSDSRPVFALFQVSEFQQATIDVQFRRIEDFKLSDNPDVYLEPKQQNQDLPRWDAKYCNIRVYEVHNFLLPDNAYMSYVELYITKFSYESNTVLKSTINLKNLAQLGRGAFVLVYFQKGEIVSISNIFRL